MNDVLNENLESDFLSSISCTRMLVLPWQSQQLVVGLAKSAHATPLAVVP